LRCARELGKTYVVDSDQSAVRPADLAAGVCETLEGLRGCHLVNEVTVNVDQASAIFLLIDNVVGEDLVVQGLGF
jgi:hypothetical protein